MVDETLKNQIDDLFSGEHFTLDAFQRAVVFMDTVTLSRVYWVAKEQEAGMAVRLKEMKSCLKHRGDYRAMLIEGGQLSGKVPWKT